MIDAARPVPLDRRTLLVTGASRGIGRAIAERMLEAGARVIGIGRDFSAWPSPPEGFQALTLDLSDLDALPGRLKQLCTEYPDIDAVVSNAGSGRFGALEQSSPVQIRAQVDLNLTQHLLLARALLPLLKRKKYGDLVFMGSEAALAGGRNGAVYSACKFALRGATQALRLECATAGVRVAIVNPGMVQSGFFDDQTFHPGEAPENHIRPGDVAEAVLLVLSAPPGTVVDEINLSPLKRVVRFG